MDGKQAAVTWSRTLEIVSDEFRVDCADLDPSKLPFVAPNYGRNQLAALFRKCGFTKGAEVGVQRGEYSKVLLEANPELHLFGVDPYRSYLAYRQVSQGRQDENYREARKLAERFRYILLVKYSLEAAAQFADNELDFVYLDGSHKFEDVVADIAAWSRVVRPGGIIAGHDYLRRRHGLGGGPNTSHHVIDAVNAYTAAYQIDPWFVLGRKEKREGEIRDRERSWLWVKK